MTAIQSATTSKSRVRQSTKKVRPDNVEKVQKIADETKQQVIEVIAETDEKLTSVILGENKKIQEKVNGFKEEILDKLDDLKVQLSSSQKDFFELKQFVKNELYLLVDELTKMGKELKTDVNDISIKHKTYLTDTFKRSKEHTLEVWYKVYTKQ